MRRTLFWSVFGLTVLVLLLGSAWTYWSFQNLPQIQLGNCFVAKMTGYRVCKNGSYYTSLSSIPEEVQWTFILAEDAAFYGHDGVDWFEIKQSFLRNLQEGQFTRGGSTITQQLAKNLFFSGEKTITRKLKELWVARKMEEEWSKKQILETYLNIVELGRNIFGIAKASKHYFNLESQQLTLVQSIFLATTLPQPLSSFDHWQQDKISKRQQFLMGVVAKRLLKFKKISQEQYELVQQALEDPLTPGSLKFSPPNEATDAPIHEDQAGQENIPEVEQ